MMKIASYNCRSFKSSITDVKNLCDMSDICLLQEHWLFKDELSLLSSVHDDFHAFGVSAIDTKKDLFVGRPYGGTAILWKKSLAGSITPKTYNDPRIIGAELSWTFGICLILCVYLPTDCHENFDVFSYYLGKNSFNNTRCRYPIHDCNG